jgi:hypothetical protein
MPVAGAKPTASCVYGMPATCSEGPILGAAACHEILTRNGEVNDNVEHLEAVLTVLARYVTQPMAS